MIHIAVCDDMPDQLTTVATMTNEYIDENTLSATVHVFSHPDQLLIACEKQRFHIYILDMVMPMINGIELGRDIRRLDREAQIIYVTTAPEFALDSFASNPLGYLVKPLQKQPFFELLALALTKIDVNENESFAVKTKSGMRVLSLSLIECCEYSDHTIIYTLSDGEKVSSVSTRSPFSTFSAPLLEDNRFLQPHSAYVVNMSRVKGLNEQGFLLRSGAVVPIAKKQFASIRKAYFNYIFGKGEE